jgi:hypothetical protein
MKSFLKELRDAAGRCPDILVSKMARDIADEIAGNILELVKGATTEKMQALNASWVRGVNILAKATPMPTTPPRSGAGEIEQERIAA